MASSVMEIVHPKVVSQTEWLAARKKLLAKEKEFTRLRDELSRERRDLPWESVEKKYVFEGARGKASLAGLFDGRSQLAVYHFMLGPGWKEGCPSCSFLADHFDALTLHLANRDTTLVVVSRAPLTEIETFKARMGWKFQWFSSFESDFNFDYRVSFTLPETASGKMDYNYAIRDAFSTEGPGLSVFARDGSGSIFHTYSTYARGLDMLVGVYNVLDLVPKGRDEDGLSFTMSWVRHHDRYSERYFEDSAETDIIPAKAAGSCCLGH